MKLKYKFDADGHITKIWFDGLDGQERVASVHQALTRLRVRNPAEVFNEDAKAGLFDKASYEEYNRMRRSAECISMLWRFEGDKPANKSTRTEANVLTLLANAIELISRHGIWLFDPEDIVEMPDFAPEPTDEETLAEIEEAEGRKIAMDIWETEDEDVELDEFGSPIFRCGDSVDEENPFEGLGEMAGEVSGDDADSGDTSNKPIRK